MSIEIEFPIEFIVPGTPVSLQAKRRQSLASPGSVPSDRSCPFAEKRRLFSTPDPVL